MKQTTVALLHRLWQRLLWMLAAPFRTLCLFILRLSNDEPTIQESNRAGVIMGGVVRNAVGQCLQEGVLVWAPDSEEKFIVTNGLRLAKILKEQQHLLDDADQYLLTISKAFLGLDFWIELTKDSWQDCLEATHEHLIEESAGD